MQVINTIQQVRKSITAVRANGKTIGLVPTMGDLHAGHISLIEAAVSACDFVVVSVFVNPSQFDPDEDLAEYPHNLDTDTKKCADAGVDIVFAPSVAEMYPAENLTWVTVEGLTENLCGRSRPIHFRGVATVCAKLFNIVKPDTAFFGQKDAQQAIVIKRMVADLNIDTKIVTCPTLRDTDGLALSSRNKLLSEAERKDAPLLNRALEKCRSLALEGEKSCPALITAAKTILAASPNITIDYIAIVDTETLADLDRIKDVALIAGAIRIGPTRLIDNILIDLNQPAG